MKRASASRGAKTKKEHAMLFEIVRGVIHQFDPSDLLALGCPSYEFDSEINAIVRQIDRIGSSQDAAHVISRVLGASFDHQWFRPEDCEDAGKRLYEALQTSPHKR